MKDARIRVGIFGAELIINALSAPDLAMSGESRTLTFSGLRKEEAQAVYRICQAQEQAWREKRRLRELEELRAKSGGIQLGTSPVSSLSPQPQTETGDAATRLQRAKEMLEKGLITDSEFETIKARIVGSI
ncbi:MAG: SHOCT domain-containing protein [Kiritimatiellaeota bacterium]|nr:SHOCT domain-containing protein [Kiritimatiellota bacterium]